MRHGADHLAAIRSFALTVTALTAVPLRPRRSRDDVCALHVIAKQQPWRTVDRVSRGRFGWMYVVDRRTLEIALVISA